MLFHIKKYFKYKTIIFIWFYLIFSIVYLVYYLSDLSLIDRFFWIGYCIYDSNQSIALNFDPQDSKSYETLNREYLAKLVLCKKIYLQNLLLNGEFFLARQTIQYELPFRSIIRALSSTRKFTFLPFLL